VKSWDIWDTWDRSGSTLRSGLPLLLGPSHGGPRSIVNYEAAFSFGTVTSLGGESGFAFS
jgi:hypothetical protein